MITVGILVAYIIALIIFSAFPASVASVGWRLVLGLGAVPALLGLALRATMPESPRWLLRHGRYSSRGRLLRLPLRPRPGRNRAGRLGGRAGTAVATVQ